MLIKRYCNLASDMSIYFKSCDPCTVYYTMSLQKSYFFSLDWFPNPQGARFFSFPAPPTFLPPSVPFNNTMCAQEELNPCSFIIPKFHVPGPTENWAFGSTAAQKPRLCVRQLERLSPRMSCFFLHGKCKDKCFLRLT